MQLFTRIPNLASKWPEMPAKRPKSSPGAGEGVLPKAPPGPAKYVDSCKSTICKGTAKLLTLHGYGPLHPFSFNPGNPDPLEQPAMVDLPRIFWAQKRPGETWDPSYQIEHSTRILAVSKSSKSVGF